MNIHIVKATGTGKTRISAFDNALENAGISNMNLIYLSSVIPPNTEIVESKPQILETDFGKRLYVVMAQKSTSIQGQTISAGLGWTFEKEKRFGLFVECEGTKREDAVRKDIIDSMECMIQTRQNYEFGPVSTFTLEATCTSEYLCIMCVAVYGIDDWNKTF